MGFFSRLFGKKKKSAKAEQNNETLASVEVKNAATPEIIEPCSEVTPENTVIETDEPVTPKQKSACGFFEIKKSSDGRYVFNLYAANKVIIATSQIYSSSQSAVNGANSVIANAARAGIEDQTQKNCTPMPYPKWEIYKDKGGQYRFRLSASNGSCVCHSQGYTTKASCKNGIESIIRTAKDAKIDKIYLKKQST